MISRLMNVSKMTQKIEGAIESEITDIDAFNSEVDLYNAEMEELRESKKRIMGVI